jgi:hypothetical protein
MMSGVDLLRMLEPAVRPVGPGGSSEASGRVPLEAQDFDALLAEAGRAGTVGESAEPHAGNDPASKPDRDPLSPLAALGSIGNASLRAMIAAGRENGGTSGS